MKVKAKRVDCQYKLVEKNAIRETPLDRSALLTALISCPITLATIGTARQNPAYFSPEKGHLDIVAVTGVLANKANLFKHAVGPFMRIDSQVSLKKIHKSCWVNNTLHPKVALKLQTDLRIKTENR